MNNQAVLVLEETEPSPSREALEEIADVFDMIQWLDFQHKKNKADLYQKTPTKFLLSTELAKQLIAFGYDDNNEPMIAFRKNKDTAWAADIPWKTLALRQKPSAGVFLVYRPKYDTSQKYTLPTVAIGLRLTDSVAGFLAEQKSVSVREFSGDSDEGRLEPLRYHRNVDILVEG